MGVSVGLSVLGTLVRQSGRATESEHRALGPGGPLVVLTSDAAERSFKDEREKKVQKKASGQLPEDL